MTMRQQCGDSRRSRVEAADFTGSVASRSEDGSGRGLGDSGNAAVTRGHGGRYSTGGCNDGHVAEAGSERAATLWNSSDRVASVRLFYPETRAALAHARRLG